jgi:hypothetical protein
MLEDDGAMGREIGSPSGAIFIERPARALLGQRLPPWQRVLEACGSEISPGQCA